MINKRILKTYLSNLKNFPKVISQPVPIYGDIQSKPQGIKLHLGCGDINLQGWINIDGRPGPHVHLVSLNFDLSEFSNASVSEIYMCHVLEHFSYKEGSELINTFSKKLMPGGVLRLSVPDFDKLIKVYDANDKNIKSIKSSLMGGQNYELNFHRSMYNKSYLIEILMNSGFRTFSEWDPIIDFGMQIGDFSNATINTSIKPENICLNIKAMLPVL